MERNVGDASQVVRIGLGSVVLFVAAVVGAGLQQVGVAAVLAVVALVLLLTGVVRFCPVRRAFGN
ncbi:YgaP-like transmembrane domain [Haloarchaeobius sp. HRN-SO-5]|uniref:YgaP-like transmembrane domain n=1 Tax=Haloarchaeobius sp. HRN-SO-5 TaxID=3446118 RepID=UPI003EBA4D8D